MKNVNFTFSLAENNQFFQPSLFTNEWSSTFNNTRLQSKSEERLFMDATNSWDIQNASKNSNNPTFYSFEYLRQNQLIQSEIDLSNTALLLNSTSAVSIPCVQNTFFHIPALSALTESNTTQSEVFRKNQTNSMINTPNELLADASQRERSLHSSAVFMRDLDWPGTPGLWNLKESNMQLSANTIDYKGVHANRAQLQEQIQNNNLSSVPSTLPTATYEALEHSYTEEQTDAMLNIFLEGLTLNEPNDSNQISDAQLQAQDALVTYCKKIIEATGQSACDMYKSEKFQLHGNYESSSKKFDKSYSTLLSPPMTPSPLANSNAMHSEAIEHKSNTTSPKTFSNTHVKDDEVEANDVKAVGSYKEPNSLKKVLPYLNTPDSQSQHNPLSPLISYKTDSALYELGNLEFSPPTSLSTMNLLYQRLDVNVQRLKNDYKPLVKDKETKDSNSLSTTKIQDLNSHPNTCKPCAFHWTKGCVNGSNCPFCHEWHAPKKKKTDERSKKFNDNRTPGW